MGANAALISLSTQIAGMVTTASASYSRSQAEKAGYEHQAQVAENNATLAEWEAKDALKRGADAEQQHRLKVAQLKSTQVASLAGRGIALDEGSALNILSDTEFMGERDALTIRDNAAKEAWGHRTQADNYRSDAGYTRGRAAAEKPGKEAFTSFLTGAGRVADSWYSYTKKT